MWREPQGAQTSELVHGARTGGRADGVQLC